MPIYEEKEKVNGQKRYYIRTYITDEYGNKKQITRHNKSWIGRDGHFEAQQEEISDGSGPRSAFFIYNIPMNESGRSSENLLNNMPAFQAPSDQLLAAMDVGIYDEKGELVGVKEGEK